ncbi:MAG: hypothetical protein JXA14_11225 [Anaerolineae bacterium]|nr:hypothetical protein [Anaerolineae bacterium]
MRVQAKPRSIFVCVLVLILTLTAVGTVAAQDGDDGDEGEPSLFEHPVVAAFRSYFGDAVAEEVAAYHPTGGAGEGEKVGYGVLVKLYAMAAESREACAGAAEPCVAVTVEELMAAYQSGVGMGQLFKEYGKPAVLGVGHLRKGDEGGPPDHAGPKDKDKGGPPDHAGPKDKDKGKDK